MYCTKCGNEIADNAFYCPSCGVQLDEDKEEQKIFIILFGVIAFIIILFLIVFLLDGRKYKYTQISDTLEAGSNIAIEEIVVVDSEDAKIIFDSATVDIKTLGVIELPFVIPYNGKEKEKTVTVNIVDTTAPKIVGKDEITISQGEDINWAEYSVEDAEDISSSSIKADKKINHVQEGSTKVTLSVEDSSGNVARS